MKINDIVICEVTGIQAYGVFISYQGYVGLIHISEISDFFIASIEDIFSVGDQIEAQIIEIDAENKKLRLSYKKANQQHPRIKKMVKIRIGFNSLKKALPHWVDKAKKKMEDQK